MGRYISVDVEIDEREFLEELDEDDLIGELERRGLDYNTKFVDGEDMRQLLETIWLKRRTGVQYDDELDQLIYGVLGKVI